MKAEPHFAGDPSPSPSVNADRIVWRWTDENNRVHRVTNACGWAVPAATNVFRPVWLRIDVGLLGGVYTFSLSGADGAFRVWPDASGTNAAPLLTGGQTVTNWAGGVTFLSGDDADLYVEAVRNGTSTLIYSYAGTGGAEGISSTPISNRKSRVDAIYATSPFWATSVK